MTISTSTKNSSKHKAPNTSSSTTTNRSKINNLQNDALIPPAWLPQANIIYPELFSFMNTPTLLSHLPSATAFTQQHPNTNINNNSQNLISPTPDNMFIPSDPTSLLNQNAPLKTSIQMTMAPQTVFQKEPNEPSKISSFNHDIQQFSPSSSLNQSNSTNNQTNSNITDNNANRSIAIPFSPSSLIQQQQQQQQQQKVTIPNQSVVKENNNLLNESNLVQHNMASIAQFHNPKASSTAYQKEDDEEDEYEEEDTYLNGSSSKDFPDQLSADELQNSNNMDYTKTSSGSRTKRKAGRKPTNEEPKSKRTAQNRAAQRAFRERKKKYMDELEDRVKELEELQMMSTRNDLAEENLQLKKKLLELEKENAVLKQITFAFDMPSTKHVVDSEVVMQGLKTENMVAVSSKDEHGSSKSQKDVGLTATMEDTSRNAGSNFLDDVVENTFTITSPSSGLVLTSTTTDPATTSEVGKTTLTPSSITSARTTVAKDSLTENTNEEHLFYFNFNSSENPNFGLDIMNLNNDSFADLFGDLTNGNTQVNSPSLDTTHSQNDKSLSFPTLLPPSEVSDTLDFDFDEFLNIPTNMITADVADNNSNIITSTKIKLSEPKSTLPFLSTNFKEEVNNIRKNMIDDLEEDTVDIINNLFKEESQHAHIKDIQNRILKSCDVGDKDGIMQLISELKQAEALI